MGYIATSYFVQRVVSTMKATYGSDGNLPRILVDFPPAIPSRDLAILKNGQVPSQVINSAISGLHMGGATAIVVACNAAHHYQSDFEFPKGCSFVSMRTELGSQFSTTINGNRVLALQSTASSKVKLWEHTTLNHGGIPVVMSDVFQEKVQALISAVKVDCSEVNTLVKQVVDDVSKSDAQILLIGCTELSLAFRETQVEDLELLDSTEILCTQLLHHLQATSIDKLEKPNLES